jgi:hypothetical protein
LEVSDITEMIYGLLGDAANGNLASDRVPNEFLGTETGDLVYHKDGCWFGLTTSTGESFIIRIETP